MVQRGGADSPTGVRRSLDDVLREQATTLTPNELFELAGFDEGTIDLFYEELRMLMRKGTIRENRPNKKDSTLEVLEQ